MEEEEVFDEILESNDDGQNEVIEEEEVVGEESGEMAVEEDVANSSSKNEICESDNHNNRREDFSLNVPIAAQKEDPLKTKNDVDKEEVIEIHALEPAVDPIVIDDNPRKQGEKAKSSDISVKINKEKDRKKVSGLNSTNNSTPTPAPLSTNSSSKKTAKLRAEQVEADRRKRLEAVAEQERVFHENKMREIELQLQAVRSQLDKMSPPKAKKRETVKLPKIKIDKYSEASLHHPNLELVMAQNAYSPYLVPPDKKYTQKTFQSGYVSELRFEKKSVAKKKIPYDLTEAKKRFIDDILKFKVDYKPAGALRRQKPTKKNRSKQSNRFTKSAEFYPTSGPPLIVETPIDETTSLSSLFEGAGNFMSLDLTTQNETEDDYLSEFAPIPDAKPDDGLKLPFERENKQYYNDEYDDGEFDEENDTKNNLTAVQIQNNNHDDSVKEENKRIT